ncbi:hypothetical protein [Brevibacterium pigmentatum]|uniref:hypothetical protein n=1 Tax=Brevibacterium pigmentatum TaxID=1496080 RepID=UPI00141DA5A0|nr:hypothetical protein [Brevibacterium pigmentatum]
MKPTPVFTAERSVSWFSSNAMIALTSTGFGRPSIQSCAALQLVSAEACPGWRISVKLVVDEPASSGRLSIA